MLQGEHYAILSTCIKLPSVFKTFVLSSFEWPLKTGFIVIILRGKRELVALLNLSSWCLVMVERLFLAMPRGCLWFVIVVFPDHTHLLFLLQLDCAPVVSGLALGPGFMV